MSGGFGALADPVFEEVDLFGVKWLGKLGWGHQLAMFSVYQTGY